MYRYILFFFTITLFNSTVSFAGPVVKLCIKLDCKQPAKVEISDGTWAKVKDLHKTPLQSDKDEQDNIANSISLIETDIFTTLAQHLTKDSGTANKIFSDISIDNKIRNIKRYLGILMDHHLVTRHVLRNTITLKSWAGIEKSALLLQSLDNSELYLIKITNSRLGTSPIIMPYREESSHSDNTVIKKTSRPGK